MKIVTIDDAMSVFDDFMCGEVDEDGTDTFLEMLKEKAIPSADKTDQWQELKETITEMRDNDGTGTQQDACRFLVNYMDVLEKQMQEPKWIPVSERLPEDEEDVLFCDLFGHIMLGYHPRDWKSTHFTESGSWELQKNVAAWMPLPSPYSTDGMASDKLTTDDGEPDGTGGQIFCP